MSYTALRNADIDAALTEAKESYVARNPKSFARYVEATAVMPGGNTRTVLFYPPFPLAMARAEGCRLWDMDGAEYVDFLGEYTAGLYGHSHPVIRAAIDRALDGGISMGAHNMLEARFARALCDRFALGSRALHQLRHRGQPAGADPGPRVHPAAEADGVRWRLPWRGVHLRRRRLAGERAVPVRSGTLQRYGGDGRPDRAARDRNWRR